MKPKCYSYVRFSSKEQAKEASLARQLEKSRDYASVNGLELDESLKDPGVSAYKGLNASEGALSRFLAEVREGNLPTN